MSRKSYLAIDNFPQFNWDQCQKGDLRYVNKDAKPRRRDARLFEKLQNQYYAMFGLGKEFEHFLELKKHITDLRLAYVVSGERMLLNQIAIEEENLRKADPNRFKGLDTEDALIVLRKWIGGEGLLDSKKITVVQFRKMLDAYVRANQKK